MIEIANKSQNLEIANKSKNLEIEYTYMFIYKQKIAHKFQKLGVGRCDPPKTPTLLVQRGQGPVNLLQLFVCSFL